MWIACLHALVTSNLPGGFHTRRREKTEAIKFTHKLLLDFAPDSLHTKSLPKSMRHKVVFMSIHTG